MREIVHIQAGQCGNQIGAKVGSLLRGWGRNAREAPLEILGLQNAARSLVDTRANRGSDLLFCAVGWAWSRRRL